MSTKKRVLIIIYIVVVIAGVITLTLLTKNAFLQADMLEDIYDESGDENMLRLSYMCEYKSYRLFFWFVSGVILLPKWSKIATSTADGSKKPLIALSVVTLLQLLCCLAFVPLAAFTHFLRFGESYMLGEIALLLIALFLTEQTQTKNDD